jgi:hypothetical protein
MAMVFRSDRERLEYHHQQWQRLCDSLPRLRAARDAARGTPDYESAALQYSSVSTSLDYHGKRIDSLESRLNGTPR